MNISNFAVIICCLKDSSADTLMSNTAACNTAVHFDRSHIAGPRGNSLVVCLLAVVNRMVHTVHKAAAALWDKYSAAARSDTVPVHLMHLMHLIHPARHDNPAVSPF